MKYTMKSVIKTFDYSGSKIKKYLGFVDIKGRNQNLNELPCSTYILLK